MPRTTRDNEILKKIRHSYERKVVQKVKVVVANYYNVPLQIYESKRRLREVVTIKHTAIYLSHFFTSLPLMDIGDLFYTDHSTIIHVLRKMEDMIATEDKTRQIVGQLKREIKHYIRTMVKEEEVVNDFCYIDMNECKSIKIADDKYIIAVGMYDAELFNLFPNAEIREHKGTELYLIDSNQKPKTQENKKLW